MAFNLYQEDKLARLLQRQIDKAWDIEDVIPMTTQIDLNKYFTALDRDALLFPGSSAEQRLVISQMMGLIICASTYEMEECLMRLHESCWVNIYKKFPVNPEFKALGEQFFEEEKKHSQTFRRFVTLFCQQSGIDEEDLKMLLPTIKDTRSEKLLKLNMDLNGQCFWWIVASVEQQFLSVFNDLRPHKKVLDPCYYRIHEKHFEEEALHSPFPHLMLELLSERVPGFLSKFSRKFDLAISQVLQGGWVLSSLNRVNQVKKLSHRHPFFEVLNSCLTYSDKIPLPQLLWKMFVRAPYVSNLVNPRSSKYLVRFAEKQGAWVLPFPSPDKVTLLDS